MARPEKTTAEIIRALKEGRDRQENFQRLFERYWNPLYRFFQKRKMPPEDCRDLTQEVFFSIYKGLRDFQQEEHFEGWLFRIAQNVYLRAREHAAAQKRAAQHVALEEAWSGVEDRHPAAAAAADSEANPMQAVLEKEKKEKLREALQELPPQMRRCIHFHLVEELSNQEIATMMNLSVNTVKAHLRQAREVLKKKVGHYFVDNVDMLNSEDM